MKKTIILRVFFLFALVANVLFAHAQAYEYVCKKEGDFWTCGLKNLIELQDDLGITFELRGRKGYLWKIYWRIYDRRESGRQFRGDAEMNENSKVVVYLENGLSLTFTKCLSLPDYSSFLYMTDAIEFLNGKQFLFNDSQRQTFAMSLLRLYNITKVSFDGKAINTPKMRSAETFNAMCKTLIAKTGDQEQFGKEKIKDSEVEDVVRNMTVESSSSSFTDEDYEAAMRKWAEEQEREAQANKRAGEKYLAEYAKQPNVRKLSSGVLYKVIKAGTGRKPLLTSTIIINYKGNTIDGVDLGDTFKNRDPMTTRANITISGFADALQQMPVGSIWEIVIPYDKAYGEKGTGKIKPYSALIFKVELLNIEEY